MNPTMKRSLIALLLAAFLAAACGGMPTSMPTNDYYRHNPGEPDLHPPIGS
jgi:hypothetical protein